MIEKLRTTSVTVAQHYNFPIILKKEDKKTLLKLSKRGLFLDDEIKLTKISAKAFDSLNSTSG